MLFTVAFLHLVENVESVLKKSIKLAEKLQRLDTTVNMQRDFIVLT